MQIFLCHFSFRDPSDVRGKVKDRFPNTMKGVDGHMAEKYIITDPEEIRTRAAELTEDNLKRDYRYHMAVKITEMLYKEGRITPTEYERICREHIRKHRPVLAPMIA